MITWKNIAWRVGWLYFPEGFLFTSLKSAGLFKRAAGERDIWEAAKEQWKFFQRKTSEQMDGLEKASFDMIRDIMQLWSTAGPSKSNETGMADTAWLVSHACSGVFAIREEPDRAREPLAPTIQHDDGKKK